MLINQLSFYIHFEKNNTFCLFGYQKATNKFVISFNKFNCDISYYQVSDKLNNASDSFTFIQFI
ncbi:hypothetical protein RN79_08975 [Streptococcus constellatus]|uniref:Uncharacterized protein n=1 Tax=Streptococcus constellatus TaxID=76860 RepID=A0A0C1KEJ4_STRCV|nr:hypothetical protein RN79_08975 [Streptococcus constellatus]